MKKSSLILALLLLVNINIFTQEANHKFTIQTSPHLYLADLIYYGVAGGIDDIFFIMDLEGQYKINNMINISLTAAFYINSYQYSDFGHKEFQMIFKPMFIYRPLRTGLKGFYLGLYPNVGWFSHNRWNSYNYYGYYGDSSDTNVLAALLGVGITTGYKWVFKNGFTLQLGAGISKTWVLPKQNSQDYYSEVYNADGSLKLENYDLQLLDLKLGYTF